MRFGHASRDDSDANLGHTLAADAVHRNGKRFVGFLADRAIAHCAGLEPLHDTLDRFHFVEWDRLYLFEIEQAAERTPVALLLVDQGRVFLEHMVTSGADGALQFVNRLRVEQVILAAIAPLILATRVEQVPIDWPLGKSALMPVEGFLRDGFDTDAFH